MPANRVPTATLKAKGSFLRHPERERARSSEPAPSGALGDPPDKLGREEKEAWHYLAALLAPGVASSMDRASMEEMACLRVICRRKRGARATAAERQLYKSYLAAFGMTPADRSRVKVDKDPSPADDPLSKLLRHAQAKVQ
jgi:hypothetical protein